MSKHLRAATAQVRNRDQYGRGVASCSLPGSGGDLGAWLVDNGLAVAYRRGPCHTHAGLRIRDGSNLRTWLVKQWPALWLWVCP